MAKRAKPVFLRKEIPRLGKATQNDEYQKNGNTRRPLNEIKQQCLNTG
jgi:hypothetical protein